MNKIVKIILKIVLAVFVLGFLSLVFVICFLFYAPLGFDFGTTEISDPERYVEAQNQIKDKESIEHFPKSIPENASDIKLYSFTSDYNGEILFLKFKIDENYIKNELKKNSFINDETPIGAPQDIYFMPVLSEKNVHDYTYYVLKNEVNEDFSKYFPYFNGIGVSKNLQEILYYYIFPAD